MKPISLIISAFGPYPDRMPEIRFDQFEKKGLFLITGDTGAGKTTIFDAICFALYGQTSGSWRDTKTLRSQYADPKTDSYVKFTFSHQGKTYTVTRWPSWDGTGTDQHREKATFQCGTGKPLEGTLRVNTAVTDLLGIDFNQFKQIAMIAQGEFWNLLNAKTDERTKILRSIFMTEGFSEMEMVLRQRQDDAVKERDRTQDRVLDRFRSAEAAPDSVHAEELKRLQDAAEGIDSAWNIDEMLDILVRLTDEDEETSVSLRNSLKEEETARDGLLQEITAAETGNQLIRRCQDLRKKREELTARAEEMQQREQTLTRQQEATYGVKPAYDAWQKSRETVADTDLKIRTNEVAEVLFQKAEKTATQNLETAVQQQDRQKDLTRQAGAIRSSMPDYASREELLTEQAAAQKDMDAITREEAALKGKEDALRKKTEDLKTRIEELQSRPEERARAAAERDCLAKAVFELDAVLASVPVCRKKLEEKTAAQFEEARAEYDVARERYDTAERLYDSCRLGNLAASLEEGSPCPVCGSTHHPDPAELPVENITEEQLKAYKDARDAAQARKDRAVADSEKASAAAEEALKTLRSDTARCLGTEIPEDAGPDTMESLLLRKKEETLGALADVNALIASLDRDIQELNKARADLRTAEGPESEALQKKREQLNEKKQNAETRLAAVTGRLSSLSSLPCASAAEALEELDRITAEISKIENALSEAQKNKAEADNVLFGIRGSLDSRRSALETQKADEAAAEEKFRSLLAEKGFVSEQEFLSFVSTDEVLRAEADRISQYRDEVKSNEGALAQAEKAADGRELVDLTALKEKMAAQDASVKQLQDKESAIEARLAGNRSRRSDIESMKAPLEQFRADAATASRLYQLVRGTTGRGKITLEQYIQATGFDTIIAAANRFLRPLSDGQFELYRQDSSLDLRSSSFLDLEVMDHYTGFRRPVGSLSGGESFLASLSLALGLTDAVSARAGGFKIEVLFIDEGFGTLDTHFIQNVLDSLPNHCGNGKLIVIISHREELKAEIPQQIRIKKGNRGSSFSIVLDI